MSWEVADMASPESAGRTGVDSYAGLLNSLQMRAHKLLDELTAYQACLRSRNKIHDVEMRIFKRGVESEAKSLDKIKQNLVTSGGSNSPLLNTAEDEEFPQHHALRSSNLPFYEAVWAIAKSSQGVTALGKRMYIAPKARGTQQAIHNNQLPSKEPPPNMKQFAKKGVLVDVVAENGLEWIKVSTITERRLLFEMAKEGWETYAGSGDEEEMGDDDSDQLERTGKLELVRVAEDLKHAAQEVRVRFQHPRVRFVLPNVRESGFPDVDAVIADLRSNGATVQCGQALHDCRDTKEGIDFDRLLPAAMTPHLTDTINIDCTILLALISDISHFSRQQLPQVHGGSTYHKAIVRQIHTEESSPLVLNELYPVLGGRALECTTHAAQRMREIVQCMGTPTERIRADIILGDGVYRSQTASKLGDAWAEHTIHGMPPEIQFPIKIVDFDASELLTASPALPICKHSGLFPSSIVKRVTQNMSLSPINTSVFLYGWASQIVTFTSNRVVATGLLKMINHVLDQGELEGDETDNPFVGPQIYICETARSLIGKSKSKGEE